MVIGALAGAQKREAGAPHNGQPGYGFPFLSMTGGFLAKDILMLGAAVWTAGEALRAARTLSPRTRQVRNI